MFGGSWWRVFAKGFGSLPGVSWVLRWWKILLVTLYVCLCYLFSTYTLVDFRHFFVDCRQCVYPCYRYQSYSVYIWIKSTILFCFYILQESFSVGHWGWHNLQWFFQFRPCVCSASLVPWKSIFLCLVALH